MLLKSLDDLSALAKLENAPKRGSAAVVILKINSSGEEKDRYVWQRKTPGYPVPSQVGGLCLFGGNKEADDATARNTLESRRTTGIRITSTKSTATIRLTRGK